MAGFSVAAVEGEAAEGEAVAPNDDDVGRDVLDVHHAVRRDLVPAGVLAGHLHVLEARVLQLRKHIGV